MQNERSSSFAADCPASDCADRPLSGRDFASPATSSVNHSRGDLAAECGDPVEGKQVEDEDERRDRF